MTPTPQEHDCHENITTSPVQDGERIVISGMSGLYPDSYNVKEFSEILYNKINPVSIKKHRYNYNHPEVNQHAGTIPDVSYFDAQFFKVYFRQGTNMDPMSRKLLEQAYQAIYDAGVNPKELFGKKVGVFIGTSFSETEKCLFDEFPGRQGLAITGCSKTMFANRISYWLNAKGPSMMIDEACCSSTAALEQAYLAISRDECETAIVGGAYLCLHPQPSVHYGRIVDLCPDGKMKAFDKNANGLARSEAINVLFLQKAKDALRMYGEVLHAKTQFTSVIEDESWRFARANPEADKVELQSIEKVFCNEREDPLLVGSVMSNMGYSEAASGITAITKVLLGYHTGELAANLHCNNPRQDVAALREGRMRIVTDHQRFRRSYVAVNGMSVTGVNSHVLLHGHYKPKDPSRYKSSIPHLVTVSARHSAAVSHILDSLKGNPIDPEQLRLLHNFHQYNIPGHLGRGFILLQTNEEQKTVCLAEKADYFDDARRPLWFVYSGMGSQWAGMGAQLMRVPIFAAAIERCRKVLQPKGLDIVDIITSSDEKTFDNILHSFVGIAAVQIGLTDVLQELGLVPDGIIGHSVGELGCAYADGCLTAEEMILSAYSRGLVSLETPFIRGSMAAIGLGYEQILPMCPAEIEVACHNSSESSTISGPADVMKEFVAQLTAKGIFAKEVPCSNIAYHSRYIASAGPQLLKYLSEVIKNPKPRTERWLSTSVPQEKWGDSAAKLCSAEYHTNNLLSSVLLEETSRLIPKNAVLVEVAPHGLLQAILKRSLPSCKNIALTRRKHPDNAVLLLEAIGKLFMEGYNPKVHVLYPKVQLPVSTGTPFLSHLVKWAHGEKWSLFMFPVTKTNMTATLDYTASVHDVENCYLQGHSMRGHALYPFAASLVLVWDTFAMTMGEPKKQLSVEFRDLHLYSQPILQDQRQLRLNVSLHRGCGSFEVLNEKSKIASGYIVALDVEDTSQDTKEERDTNLSTDLTSEDIYCLLRDRDYSYSGDFCSIEAANKSLSAASLVWRDNWVTLIDGMLQLNMLRQPHDGVSLPTHIRNITIDVDQHQKAVQQSFVSDYKVLLKADVLENFDITRCGGIAVKNIKYENLPPLINKHMMLKVIKFMPYIQSDISNVSSSLQFFLQTVAENMNKENLRIVGIVDHSETESIFHDVITARNIVGVNVKYEEVTRESVLEKQNNFLKSVDLVLVQNLSTDDNMCKLLHSFLQKDQFVMTEENSIFGGRSRPSSLYRVLADHTVVHDDDTQQSRLQLVRWRPAAAVPTTTVTVRTDADIPFLTSARNRLSSGHRLLIIAPYPALPGLKDLLKGWRQETDRNQVHLIMIAKENDNSTYIDEIPNIDLVFNVFCNGTLGAEHYVPHVNSALVSTNVTLQCGQFGDYDSLTWVEAPQLTGCGIDVMVHYAGINQYDVKKANGSSLCTQNKNTFGLDFSGITSNGSRVMGLVSDGAASSVVRARPELLWPVPAHWSLEDAATVPLAYAHAFYCLVVKRQAHSQLTSPSETSVLIHGGAGALGQAAISIALAYGYEVFTTVSDLQKKHFLRKLFPALKAEHIANSRDHSFGDVVRNATKGKGCNIVVSSTGIDLKKVSIDCTGDWGLFMDISQLQNKDDFTYGLFNLTRNRAYNAVDFSSLYDPENIKEAKLLQRLLADGIRAGFVRPLSRVTYAPHDAARAFRLLAASKHRGKVLLNMHQSTLHAQPRLTCNADNSHLIIGYDEILGLQLGDKLVERDAKKLCVYFKSLSMRYLEAKIRLWQKMNVEVVVFTDNLLIKDDVVTLLNKAQRLGPVEGVYVTVGDKRDVDDTTLSTLDLVSRELCPDIKYFAVLNVDDRFIGKDVCQSRVSNNLPATMLSVSKLNLELCNVAAWYRGVVEVTENALHSTQSVFVASDASSRPTSLLQQILALADISVKQDTNTNTTLEELGVEDDKIPRIRDLLRIHYNVMFEEKDILLLTIDTIRQLENSIISVDFKDDKGLSTFFTYVDSDELLATTDLVILPTLVINTSTTDHEFYSSQTCLCIVPGMEGHHERFRVLCERLKPPALVLQPGLDHPEETIPETAERLAAIYLKKTGLKNHFNLLGYETGIYIALEMAAILENHGLTGTVFCIGYTLDELDAQLQEQLSEFETDEQLQDAIVLQMFTLMSKSDTTSLKNALQTANTWPLKVEAYVRTLLGRVPHSAQYARALIETAVRRIERARGYVPRVQALRSQLVLMRAASAQPAPAPLALQQHSQRPVAVHQLRAPLAHALQDLRCATIVNTYLDPAILDSFDKKNICNSYVDSKIGTYTDIDE